MDLKELIDRMKDQTESICRYLLPNGKVINGEYCVGDLSGSVGKSLKVNMNGKSGIWADFAADQSGDIFDLWKGVRNINTIEAIKEIKNYLNIYEIEPVRDRVYRKPKFTPKPIVPRIIDYLRSRGISDDAREAYKVTGEKNIYFPYYKNDELVNHKIRSEDKKFMQSSKDAEPCLFGWQVIQDEREVIICEGEIDALSWYTYGYKALSVPFGAGNNQWIENDWEELERFEEIYISFDMDSAGQKAIPEIIKRLGSHRVKIINLPEKDINECIKAEILETEIEKIVDNAEYQRVESIKSFAESKEDMWKELFTEVPEHYSPSFHSKFTNCHFYDGEVSLWAGINGHGKTSFMMQLALDLVSSGRKVCIASLEQKSVKYLKKIIWLISKTKYVKKEIVEKIYNWLGRKVFVYDRIGIIKPDEMLESFKYAAKRYKINHFVIDSLSKCGFAEDDYNGQKLFVEKLTALAMDNDIHIHLIHHVRKGAKETKASDKFDIKGTGAITDMVFNVFMILRNKEKEQGKSKDVADTTVICQKQREHGWEGVLKFKFNKNCDMFYENEMVNYEKNIS